MANAAKWLRGMELVCAILGLLVFAVPLLAQVARGVDHDRPMAEARNYRMDKRLLREPKIEKKPLLQMPQYVKSEPLLDKDVGFVATRPAHMERVAQHSSYRPDETNEPMVGKQPLHIETFVRAAPPQMGDVPVRASSPVVPVRMGQHPSYRPDPEK